MKTIAIPKRHGLGRKQQKPHVLDVLTPEQKGAPPPPPIFPSSMRGSTQPHIEGRSSKKVKVL